MSRIEIKTTEQIAKMRAAGRIAARCHQMIASKLAPGVATLEIDRFVDRWLAKQGASAAQKGYRSYPFAICASRNEVVCHGLPNNLPLRSGDIVTIDLVVNYKGWLADMAWTYTVGKVQPEVKKLVYHAHKALLRGVQQVRVGSTVGDVSAAMGRYAREKGYGMVLSMIGHGIGRELHQAPEVPNDGIAGTGPMLQRGMVITVEPILTLGRTGQVWTAQDGWSVHTVDGSWGAHFEHTVAVTAAGGRILTEFIERKKHAYHLGKKMKR
ncbi:type I methionyl aminopeptidase [Paenibacillus marinisediminis]